MTLSSKERIMMTMSGEIPDRVPVQLGITNMFSVLHAGRSAWDVYVDYKTPLWKVVTDAARHFGLDGYLYLNLHKKSTRNDVTMHSEQQRMEDRVVVRRTISTPEGDLFEERTFLRNETGTVTTGLVKNKRDFELWLKYCLHTDHEYESSNLKRAGDYLGQDGVAAGTVGIPGLAHLADIFEGRLANATFFAYDYPELIEEYRVRMQAVMRRDLEALIDAGVDYIQIASSGMLTLSNPEMFRSLCLPTIVEATRICKEAGVLTELHCCGKERLVIEACYNETDLDSINPLQPPPMGDCDLAEIKRSFGDRLCLKGNVGVTDPLLMGSPEDVEQDVIRCMDAAKAGGRYILFSEEGIGANTPHENVRRYVEAGRHYGAYT